MRITQGCFSFLPDLTDEQITSQVQYCLEKGWAVNIEFTDDPHPRNTYWEMWGLPMFDLHDAAGVMREFAECRKIYGDRYIRLSGFDASHGWEVGEDFLHRQPAEAGGWLSSGAAGGRRPQCALHDPRLCRRSARGQQVQRSLKSGAQSEGRSSLCGRSVSGSTAPSPPARRRSLSNHSRARCFKRVILLRPL